VHSHPYVIYDASAGSGKTFTLVKEYLKLVLAPGASQNFRKILAITFTNKAVNEMKQRILESLYAFGQSENTKGDVLLLQLSDELGIQPDQTRIKARKVLKEILHNYAFFDISTIDKFTHRLIKTFAKDLQIPQNFEVVLDVDLLLDEAVERLIGNAMPDQQMTSVLIDFALEKIDDNKSWDIAYDLSKVGKMLFNENHATFIEDLKSKDLPSFKAMQQKLNHAIQADRKQLEMAASEVLSLLVQHQLEPGDFKSSYFPKFMVLIINNSPSINFDANWKQNFGSEPLYNKSCPEEKKQQIEALMPRFTELFRHIKERYEHAAFLQNVYQNIVPLTILNALQKEIDALLKERDQLPISSFNTLISAEIKEQPAPFIYERLGEKYRHYFIDEFQDTSLLQWNNLVPLISNAIQSEDLQGNRGSLFLVGDAKQAIYRWRGGRSEQFLSLLANEQKTFNIPPVTRSLGTNYRSHEEIVRFNNEFFTLTSPLLNNNSYQELFLKGNQQQHTAKKGGMVSIRFIEDEADEKVLLYCEEVLRCIEEALHHQFTYKDICILFRTRKQGVQVAEYLIQKGIPILSSETLLLKNSAFVSFLVHLLRFSRNGSDLNLQYEILYFLSPPEGKHAFIRRHLNKLEALFEHTYDFHIPFFNKHSVYDSLEYAIRKFNLTGAADAYISHFLDEVLDVELQKDASLATFLAHWDKKQESLSIPAPENLDAVQLMTIHKAKGLEFPIVIFPFANTAIYDEKDAKIWVPVVEESLQGFKNILLSKKKEMIFYNEESRIHYEQEQEKMELDAFNLLYVALTRSIQGLFIITELDLTMKGDPKLHYYSGLFIQYLKETDRWDSPLRRYDMGQLVHSPENKKLPSEMEVIPYIFSHKFEDDLQLSTKAGELWGTSRDIALSRGMLLHYGLSLLHSTEDLQPTLALLVQTGAISEEEYAEYYQTMKGIVEHPALREHFKNGLDIRNEQTIIDENGVILRPDRMVFKNKKATVIDYKTGDRHPSHKEQIIAYGRVLKNMGYTVDNLILVYIQDSITTEFI